MQQRIGGEPSNEYEKRKVEKETRQEKDQKNLWNGIVGVSAFALLCGLLAYHSCHIQDDMTSNNPYSPENTTIPIDELAPWENSDSIANTDLRDMLSLPESDE